MEVSLILEELEDLSNQADKIHIQLECNSNLFRKILTEAMFLGGKIFPLLVKLEESSIEISEREVLFQHLNVLSGKLNSIVKICSQLKNKSQ